MEGVKIIDPTYKILNFIENKNPELLAKKEYTILFGNLRTHFFKLFYSVTHISDIQKFYSVTHISDIQKDCIFMNNYNQTSFIGTMLVEYPYFKLSTIWDIAYQIGSKLTKLKNSKGNKYEALEEEFASYTQKLNNLNIAWYQEINKIRNRIVHGGIKVTSFYLDNKNDWEIKNRLCFQMYDNDLNDLIPTSNFYTNTHNNNINFADNYFAFYTSTLYSYLIDFFDFILLKICDENKLKLTDFDKPENSEILKMMQINYKYWCVADMDKFKDIAINMLKLHKNKGKYYGTDRIIITPAELEHYFPLLKPV